MATSRTARLRISNDDINVVCSWCILGSTINRKGTNNPKISHIPVLGKEAMKTLEKFKCYNASILYKLWYLL